MLKKIKKVNTFEKAFSKEERERERERERGKKKKQQQQCRKAEREEEEGWIGEIGFINLSIGEIYM